MASYGNFGLKWVADILKETKVVTYCSVGVRSERIGEKVLAAGYQYVHNLYGSLFDWVNERNLVADKQGRTTECIHSYSQRWGIGLKKTI